MARRETKSLPDTLRELWQLLLDYAKQELTGPFSGLGTYLKWGFLGATLLVFGVLLLSLAVLRGLQRLSFTHAGIGSTVPYLAAFAFDALVVGLCIRGIKRSMAEHTPNVNWSSGGAQARRAEGEEAA